jgi:peptidoglycan/LPS O-acetylase OafA/YrhL
VDGALFPHIVALDGLRGVAVALVVGYHLAPDALPGGFLGVDVFFVLSGFLITSLLLAEAQTEGRVDLRRFYLRRVRRLAPALLLVLLSLSMYAQWSAPQAELARLREHSLWTLGYLANWKYIAEGLTYTDLVLGQSPLRHTWSLAIEEQFYLVVPLLVILGGVLTHWRPTHLRRWVLVGSLVAAVASALLMAVLWGDGSDPSRGYFGTDARAHSLLVGVALGAVLVGRPPAHGPWARRLSAAGFAGVGVLVAAVALGHETSSWLQHGGFLLVAVAVAGIIGSLGRRGVIANVLSTRPLVALGVVSYGVYLWHWPIVVLLDEAQSGLDGLALGAARAAATLVAATASYAIVERPVRRGVLGRSFRGVAPALVVGATAALVALILISTTVPRRGPTAVASATAVEPRVDALGAVLLGDSVAHTIAGGTVSTFPHYEPWAPAQSPFDPALVTLWSLARPGCSYLPDVILSDGTDFPLDLSSYCGEWRHDLDTALVDHPSAWVLVALRNDGADRLVDGQKVDVGTEAHRALLYRFLDDVRAIATRRGAAVGLVPLPPEAEMAGGASRERLMRDAYVTYAVDRQDVRVLDLFDAFCPDADCGRPPPGFDRGWRYDGLHYTADGARWIARWLTPQLLDRIG